MKRAFMYKLLLISSAVAITATAKGQLNPLSLSRIDAGDSVVIYYDVTINTGCNCTQIVNQGTVSGSNFTTLNTDDPDTGPLGDATITMLNLFPLPVHLVELKASKGQGGIDVSWTVASESNIWKYEVERSTDGSHFNKVGEVISINSAGAYDYLFLDVNASAGVYFYRLRIVELSGVEKYSGVVRINLSGKESSVVLYPNPVRDGQFALQISNVLKGRYQLVFYNASGQIVFEKAIVHDGGSSNRVIQIGRSLPAGVYQVQFRNNGVQMRQMVLVE